MGARPVAAHFMRYYLYVHGKLAGPYLPGEVSSLFGRLSPEILACSEFEYDSGKPQWKKLPAVAELAPLASREAAEPLPRQLRPEERRKALRILSTDDDSNIRALLWGMLSDAGHEVEFARDGEEVFQRLAAKPYDLVILDVNMPKMNGYKVSELIHEKLPRPPKVIIFTGRDLEAEKLQFVCSGADAILNKGTGNDKLMDTIASLFAQKDIPAGPEPAAGGGELEVEHFPSAEEPVSGGAASGEPVSVAPAYQPVAAADAAPPVPAPASPPPPAQARPAPAPQEGILHRLISENKRISGELTEIRRLLGHVELEYTQLEGQFEKQAAKVADRSREYGERLEQEWRSLKKFAALLLLALLSVLAAIFAV